MKDIFIIPVLAGSIFLSFFSRNELKFIPVTFDPDNGPIINVEVEGKKYPVLVDLGAKWNLDLDGKILENVQKKAYGTRRFIDLKGRDYESQSYLVPKVKIGDALFEEVIVEEKNVAFHQNTAGDRCVSNNLSERKGIIGRTLLKRQNLLLDFPNARLAIIDADDKEIGYPLENMLKVPFEMTPDGIVLNVETDLGKKRLLVDSGVTYILIRSSSRPEGNAEEKNYLLSSRFIIGGKDFGQIPLDFIDMAPEISEIDGLLGMGFLLHHPIYIDFRKNVLYIGETVRRVNPPRFQKKSIK